MGSQASAAKLA
ncbi:hypothetical protein E2C01_078811 [Portunus trituberculatus]|uniref:Uncharacterized protein n=1 Tax=Portunus trituberculatus TaxID=210409 RepID=A0A5B7INP4_PORTR|nr:hypothetical protein [Portunus trituberculatus]